MRILLVEDDQMLGDAMCVALQRAGYTVDWLRQGGSVVTTLQSEEFLAVILDLGLPDMDGLSVLRQVRARNMPHPVLILTARDGVEDRVRGLDIGADDYMNKPFALDELLARLRALLRRSGGRTENRIQIGPVLLLIDSGEVYLDGQPVPLTRNEFKLLSVLALRGGRVMSKDALLQSLHGWTESATDNAIEVHIHNLRKKLGSQLIKTVRGLGYAIGE